MSWVFLLAAGVCEMFGVMMIHKVHKERNLRSVLYLIGCFGTSFLLLAVAMEQLEMSTAYAVWTGIGVTGGAVLGMLVYNEPKDWRRLLFIGLILVSVAGLKLIS